MIEAVRPDWERLLVASGGGRITLGARRLRLAVVVLNGRATVAVLVLGPAGLGLGHVAVGRVDRLEGGKALAAPGGPDQEDFLEQAITVDFGLGEEEATEAALAVGA